MAFLKDGTERLNYLGQGKAVIRADETIESLKEKLDDYEFLVELLVDIDTDALYVWKEMFEVEIVQMKKSKKKVALKGVDEYIKYLASSGIDGK